MVSFRALTDRPLPERLYLDAGFLFRVLMTTHRDHRECLRLLKEAITGPTRLYSSQILFPEINDAFLKDELRSTGNEELLRTPDLIPDGVWDEVRRVSHLLDDLLISVPIECCKLDPKIRQEAVRLQRAYRMRVFDAIHAATATLRGVTDIVCFDRDFHPVAGLTIWTARALMHARLPC